MPISPPVNVETAIVANEKNINGKTASAAFFNAIMFAQLQREGIKESQYADPVELKRISKT